VPSTATLSRRLRAVDATTIANLQELSRELVLDRLVTEKLRRARLLLVTGRWRVSEVAEQVGFDSPYNFSRRFKEHYDVTPSSLMPAPPAGDDSDDSAG